MIFNKFIRFSFFCAMALLSTLSQRAMAQTVALSDDPNFISASLLIAFPGPVLPQAPGHAFIRMQCPEQNLDQIFTFENNGDNNFFIRFIEGADGRVMEFDYSDYMPQFVEEGRQVNSYSLNLSLNEKARLWEVLDSLKTLPPRSFDVIRSHCFSEIAVSIEIAIRPARVMWDSGSLQTNTYAENMIHMAGEKSPWHVFLLQIPITEILDKKDSGRRFVYPTIFAETYSDFIIEDPDGSTRPLVIGEPEILLPDNNPSLSKPVHPTPIEAAFILFVIVVIVTALQAWRGWKLPGVILDSLLWTLAIVGGLFIAIVSYIQMHSVANLTMIVLNPLAWLPLILCRYRARARHWIWIAYTVILVLFAVAIPLVSPGISAPWRILAATLAIRSLFHALNSSKRNIAER